MTVRKEFEDFALAMNIILNLDDSSLENAKHWIEHEQRQRAEQNLPESCRRAHEMKMKSK